MNIDDFIINGFTYKEDHEIINMIGKLPKLSDWVYCKKESEVRYPENVSLQKAQSYIFEKYIMPFSSKYDKSYFYIWEGIATTIWHNDLGEGCNLTFLYYLNDVRDGGEICFRVNKKETGYIKPKKGLLVMLSQDSRVEHKVNPTKEVRMVCNFGYNIKWI